MVCSALSTKTREGHSDPLNVGDQTEPADFEVAPEARRRYLVAVDHKVLARVQRLAQMRGVSSESLVNLLLEQRLQEVESQAAKA